jgi:signal transduction histidine kinase
LRLSRLSVTARIALLSFALALASNLALVGVVRRQTRSDALDAIRRETVEQADALTAVYRTGGLPAVKDAIADARAPGDTSLLLAVLDGEGKRITGFGPAALSTRPHPVGFRIAPLAAGAARQAGYELRALGPDWLLAGRTLDLLATEQQALERALVVAVALSLALGVAAGLVLARYVGRRLDGIVRVIDAAAEGDLSRRVGRVTGSGDAFDRLAGRLDAMLAKVEALMGELRLVTDGLAHDLRSPLARLRARAERAALAEPGQRDAALSSLLVETDLVMRMLTTAIEISRSEAVARDRLQPAAPADLVAAVAELYEPVAEEAGLAFHLRLDARPAAMRLHRELLSQAVANLLDNAIKHAGGGGEVTLRLSERGEEVAVAVEDRGPGIAEGDRARARARFGRLDAARSTPGAGLGMALVEAVARLHGGRFELADHQPGLVARIVLPAG